MTANKKKTCIDCLNCKVSAMSTPVRRKCFCSESKKKTVYNESYWLVKKPCDEFDDMGEKSTSRKIIPAIAIRKRKPLIRKRLYVY